jgi:AcrR family transcriptional regulator
VPTGHALQDPRQQLFAAAERVLLRDGAPGLTGRSVTAEAGVAKGVLHRHFADFDAFLVDLVLDRIGRLDDQTAALGERVGAGTVTANLTDALVGVLDSVALSMVALITARDELRARLRRDLPAGVPVLTEAAILIGAYLGAEQDRGRISPAADVETLAAMLIGTGHLLFAGQDREPVDRAAVRRVVETALAGVLVGDPPT